MIGNKLTASNAIARPTAVHIQVYGNLFSIEAEFVGDVSHVTLEFDDGTSINRREGSVDSNTGKLRMS